MLCKEISARLHDSIDLDQVAVLVVGSWDILRNCDQALAKALQLIHATAGILEDDEEEDPLPGTVLCPQIPVTA